MVLLGGAAELVHFFPLRSVAQPVYATLHSLTRERDSRGAPVLNRPIVSDRPRRTRRSIWQRATVLASTRKLLGLTFPLKSALAFSAAAATRPIGRACPGACSPRPQGRIVRLRAVTPCHLRRLPTARAGQPKCSNRAAVAVERRARSVTGLQAG